MFAQGGTFAWRKMYGEMQRIADLQPLKWGYDPWVGSSFTVNFWRGPGDYEKTWDNTRVFSTRILALIDAEDREEIARLQNSVLKKCRVPTAEEFLREMGFPPTPRSLQDRAKKLVLVTPTCMERKDVWFAFIDNADIDAWCVFLKEWLPKGLTRFASLEDLRGHGFSSDLQPRWNKA